MLAPTGAGRLVSLQAAAVYSRKRYYISPPSRHRVEEGLWRIRSPKWTYLVGVTTPRQKSA